MIRCKCGYSGGGDGVGECWGGHIPRLSLTEEMILNDDHMGALKGWRRFRIEYGFECSCPEGVIYTPFEIDPTRLEEALQAVLRISPPSYEDLTDETSEDSVADTLDPRKVERRLRVETCLRELCLVHDRLQDALYSPLATEGVDRETVAGEELPRR